MTTRATSIASPASAHPRCAPLPRGSFDGRREPHAHRRCRLRQYFRHLSSERAAFPRHRLHRLRRSQRGSRKPAGRTLRNSCAEREGASEERRRRYRAQSHHSRGPRGGVARGDRSGQARLFREAARDRGRRRRGDCRRRQGAGRARRRGARHGARRRGSGSARADRRRRDRQAAQRARRGDVARHGALASQPRLLLPRRRRPGVRHGALLSVGPRHAARPGRRRPGDRPDRLRRTYRDDARLSGAAGKQSRSRRSPTSMRCSILHRARM